MAVIAELGGEKIDIIQWSDSPEELVAHSLSPAKVSRVVINQDKERSAAVALVPEDQLSLAIGKDGQNVRLAAKLTGWKIDVRNETAVQEAVEPAEAVEADAKEKVAGAEEGAEKKKEKPRKKASKKTAATSKAKKTKIKKVAKEKTEQAIRN
jgi:N utilization substance protein A